jgi:1-acyl-sn-glycerol-3-phosphate acyltransferase
MHGHLFIILKESIKYVPLIGSAMKFYSFILLSRRWTVDKMRFKHRLDKLKIGYNGPSSASLTPMWLLIFPEGTNVSKNGRATSRKWADKQGIVDMRHCLLPRSTGLAFCLTELEGSVEYLYDCTLAYGGIP